MNHPYWKGMQKLAKEIELGMRLNRRAAGLTGISALMMFLSWIVSALGS
jgi:hypothetical protein